MALFELTGKTVVVAGAGSGIGRATALMVASQGATVVVADIADSAHETVTQITDAGGSARAAVGDISDPVVAEALIADADADGSIVNVSSEAGIRGAAAGAAYTASKHGLIGLTRNTAYMYGKAGVRCNAIMPGGVETNIMASIDQSKLDMEGLGVLGAVHAGALRNAKPDELAALVVFLLAVEASNVNGALIANDGGWSAG